ncbi:hypothetical protein [Ktedonobacter racemifer]|uniref:Uncharacterized protein n=1 Tax=Ktedonobacter racemifer DSM 44963 TaxID=485913 RepID=D6TLE5_KTERA|nr:hypothetical protein [Ktedonobacter racemifer]EFH86595.1 conserved hypothetical protein [Ktedonobacter racemifer DSM 44963]
MSRFQPTPRHSLTRGAAAAAARAINAHRVPSLRALAEVIAVTVKIEGEKPDIIVRNGRFGTLYLPCSAITPTRFYAVNWTNGQHTFDCDEVTGRHLVKRIEAYSQTLAA